MTLIYRLIAWVMRRLPRPILEGSLYASFWSSSILPWNRRRLLNIYRRILAHSGETPSQIELERILKESLHHYTRLIISLLCRPEDIQFAKQNVDLECLPRIETALKGNKGLILVCSNFGLFVHALLALRLRGFRLHIPVIQAGFYAGLPEDWSDMFLSLGNASRVSLEALKRNEIVVVPTLYNFMPRSIPIDFFGAPADLTYAPARLSISSGAPILPLFAVDEGEHCRAVTDEAIQVDKTEGALMATTQKLARIQEKYIARYPAQWEAYDDIWDLEKMRKRNALVRKLSRWF